MPYTWLQTPHKQSIWVKYVEFIKPLEQVPEWNISVLPLYSLDHHVVVYIYTALSVTHIYRELSIHPSSIAASSYSRSLQSAGAFPSIPQVKGKDTPWAGCQSPLCHQFKTRPHWDKTSCTLNLESFITCGRKLECILLLKTMLIFASETHRCLQ